MSPEKYSAFPLLVRHMAVLADPLDVPQCDWQIYFVIWYFGTLLFWYLDIFVFCLVDILVFQYFGILIFWYFGILFFWYFGILVQHLIVPVSPS